MTTTVVDERGRLIEFVAIPPPVRPAAPATPTDWGRLFEAAGLRLSDFQAVDPQRTPRAFADETAAWDGPLRDGTNVRVRVEAAAFGGRPVFFTLTGPWTRAPRVEAPPPPAWTARVLSAVGGLLGLTVVILALALARANVRSGRSDWRGATRVFTAVLLIWIAAWGTGARHYLSLSTESDRFFIFMAVAILNSGRIFVLYLALEPYVRRFCPDILISWTRLLAGGIRDERVGRDLLIGIAVGVFLGLVLQLSTAIPAILYGNTQLVRLTSFQFMLGPHMVLSNLLQILPNALGNAMTATFVFVMLRALVRRAWLAAALALALFTAVVMAEVTGDHFVVRAGFAMLFVVPVLVALLRFGVLAQISALLVNQALATVAFSLNLGRPYAPSGLLLIVAILGLSAFAFRTSRAQERLFAGVMA